MNAIDPRSDGLALLHYGTPDFAVLKPGRFVRCAVSGKEIPLEALRYWSASAQEAYAGAAECLQAVAGAGRRAVMRRRAVLAGAGAALAAGAARAVSPMPTPYTADLKQGGWLMLRADPGSTVAVDDALSLTAPASGLLIVGYDRDAPASTRLSVQTRGVAHGFQLPIAPVAYDIQRIDGLPEDQVAPSDPILLERIKRELAFKQKALASQDASEGFRSGFILPVDHAIKTSAFGPQRILNGVPKTPHYGVDLAVPTGTPIHAPADGLVVLAEPHMHFEGGLTLIDHGQGLISMYLHQSAQQVSAGQRVRQGQTIGAVGMTGRATGPHLCWRMTWRGRHMDPSLLVGAAAPV